MVFTYSNGLVEGFIGMLHGTEVSYFQVADIALSFKLFDSFKWLTALANDSDIRKKTSELELQFNQKHFDK